MSETSLAALLSQSIAQSREVIATGSTSDQAKIEKLLANLTLCAKLIARLGIFSPNEEASEVATGDLKCFLIDAYLGHLSLYVRTPSTTSRLASLKAAKSHFEAFTQRVDEYGFIPPQDRAELRGPAHSVNDPRIRRAGKIAQFKRERALKAAIDAGEERVNRGQDVDDAVLRGLYTDLIAFEYLRAFSELASIEQEDDIITHGMQMTDISGGRISRQITDGPGAQTSGENGNSASNASPLDESSPGSPEDTTWRLDNIPKDPGALLDKDGHVLRPFTILPAQNALDTRLRLGNEVFRPSHRLPTMTIDEFLDEEKRRGNFLQGGGPSTSAEVEVAEGEERALKEQDTAQGYAMEEAQVMKDREWDAYKDDHKRGEGNRYNRG